MEKCQTAALMDPFGTVRVAKNLPSPHKKKHPRPPSGSRHRCLKHTNIDTNFFFFNSTQNMLTMTFDPTLTFDPDLDPNTSPGDLDLVIF